MKGVLELDKIKYLKNQFLIGLIVSLFFEIFMIYLLFFIEMDAYPNLSKVFFKNFILIYGLSIPLIILYTLNSLLYKSKNRLLYYLSLFFTLIIILIILTIYLFLIPFIEGFGFGF